MAVVYATQIQCSLMKFDTQNQQLWYSTPKLHFQRNLTFQSKLHFKNPETEGDTVNHPLKMKVLKQKGFSLLEMDPPWKSEDVWSTMALYFFSLHIPFSFGGLSVLAHLLNHPILDPQTKAVAILIIETLEMFCAMLLLQLTVKPNNFSLFLSDKTQSERNWILTALSGFLILVLAMFLSSFLPDALIDTKGASNQTVKEILLNNSVSQTCCALVYCLIAPLLEEMVYRRFLLTSLARDMDCYQAVMISSLIFSAAHFSGENFIQLVIVGMVLGCSYCWTGDLRSSILLHSMYNALTLLIAVFA